jgi:hypothetical protein
MLPAARDTRTLTHSRWQEDRLRTLCLGALITLAVATPTRKTWIGQTS